MHVNGSTLAGGHSSDAVTLSKPIAKCGVLYLGSAVPRPDIIGIDSIQEPLSKRYPVDSTNNVYGIDSVLIVRENGAELIFNQDPSISLFYPIESLVYCASVRFATQPPYSHNENTNGYNVKQQWPFKNNWGFAPLDSPFANGRDNQHHPPLFCAIFKRTRNVAADECHCFITKTKESAMILVHACFTAFNKQQKQFPSRFYSNSLSNKRVPVYIKSSSINSGRNENVPPGKSCYEVDHRHVRVIEAPTSNPIVDYMTNPNGDGFFYTSDRVSIDTWQLWEERQGENVQSNENEQPAYQMRSAAPVPSSRVHQTVCSSGSTDEENDQDKDSDGSNSSFESTTEYYHGISKKYVLPKEIAEKISNTTTKYGAVDPYEPAPNLVKVEHKRDPTTGANIFVRWFQPEEPEAEIKKTELESPDRSAAQKLPPAPRVSRSSSGGGEKNGKPVLIIREMDMNGKQPEKDEAKQTEQSKLKSILRKTKRSRERSKANVANEGLFDRKAYQITEAYFEDRKGKVHRVLNKKDRGKSRSKLLDDVYEDADDCDSAVSEKSPENGGNHYNFNAGQLPLGAKVADAPLVHKSDRPATNRYNHQSLQRAHTRRNGGQRRHHSIQESGGRQRYTKGTHQKGHVSGSRRQHHNSSMYSDVRSLNYQPINGGYQQINNMYGTPQFQHDNVHRQRYRSAAQENMMMQPPQQMLWGPAAPIGNPHPFYQSQMYSLM